MNTHPEQNNANHTDPILQGIKDRSESYLSTIYALHGFIYVAEQISISQSNEVHSSIGRRMNYASSINKKDVCTPDMVIQLQPSEGIVGEAKLLVCQNIDDHWNKYIKQLKKYDSDLVGWWTDNEKIDHSSLVWITELTFSTQISEYFQNKIDSGEVHFDRPLAVIEFVKQQRARVFIFFRTRMGSMPNPIMEKVFKDGKEIPLETLIVENKEKKFYDAKPQDIEYIMEILWQNIFNQDAVVNESGSVIYNAKEKFWRIPVDVDTLTTRVQQLYGSVGSQNREVEYPHTSWIREAFDKFVSIGLAEKGPESNGYTIFFKKFSRPLEKFVQLINKKKKVQTEDVQLELFHLQNE